MSCCTRILSFFHIFAAVVLACQLFVLTLDALQLFISDATTIILLLKVVVALDKITVVVPSNEGVIYREEPMDLAERRSVVDQELVEIAPVASALHFHLDCVGVSEELSRIIVHHLVDQHMIRRAFLGYVAHDHAQLAPLSKKLLAWKH